ncbi:unnamed protein product [Staurois parvus]|uniref:Uncharacterized protein n=1 Tax=Staurois parvus TaxID=386267 RepID=A0ABN9GTN6_9NEOB|nr:unnamed protein product [Staurois parvus]
MYRVREMFYSERSSYCTPENSCGRASLFMYRVREMFYSERRLC